MKRLIYAVILIPLIGAGSLFASLSAPPESLFCVGTCRGKAERQFELLYGTYMRVATACAGIEESRRILAELSPALAQTVDEKNRQFSLLADKERDGTLTVQERSEYSKDKWRVNARDVRLNFLPFNSSAGASNAVPVIRHCLSSGFNIGSSGFESYCDSFTHIAVDYRPGSYNSPQNALVLLDAKSDLFSRLKSSGELFERTEELRSIESDDYKARDASEVAVASSSAADIPEGKEREAVEAKFAELRCQSWATQAASKLE